MLRSGRDGKCNAVSMRIYFSNGCYYTQCVRNSSGAGLMPIGTVKWFNPTKGY
jgi:hypothetical protein